MNVAEKAIVYDRSFLVLLRRHLRSTWFVASVCTVYDYRKKLRLHHFCVCLYLMSVVFFVFSLKKFILSRFLYILLDELSSLSTGRSFGVRVLLIPLEAKWWVFLKDKKVLLVNFRTNAKKNTRTKTNQKKHSQIHKLIWEYELWDERANELIIYES